MGERGTEITIYIREGQEKEGRIKDIGAKFLKAKINVKVVELTEDDLRYMPNPPYISSNIDALIRENEIDNYIKKYKKIKGENRKK